MMSKRFFEMTRHERRGAIALLALILALVAASAVMRCHRDAPAAVNSEDIRRFEAEIDSVTVTDAPTRSDSASSRPSRPALKKPHRIGSHPGKAPAREPRPLDPVPQL